MEDVFELLEAIPGCTYAMTDFSVSCVMKVDESAQDADALTILVVAWEDFCLVRVCCDVTGLLFIELEADVVECGSNVMEHGKDGLWCCTGESEVVNKE